MTTRLRRSWAKLIVVRPERVLTDTAREALSKRLLVVLKRRDGEFIGATRGDTLYDEVMRLSLSMSELSRYRTIKEIVIETCMAEGRFPSYEKLTSLVRQHFPSSKGQKTHYAWYKSKIKTGEIVVHGISSEATEELPEDQVEAEVEESIEASVSLERDLHSYLTTSAEGIGRHTITMSFARRVG